MNTYLLFSHTQEPVFIFRSEKCVLKKTLERSKVGRMENYRLICRKKTVGLLSVPRKGPVTPKNNLFILALLILLSLA